MNTIAEIEDAIEKLPAPQLEELADWLVALRRKQTAVTLTPDEQLAFWTALNEPVKLTPAQKKLGRAMQGKP
jgi:hypothetical protein